LKGASGRNIAKGVLGAVAIVAAAVMLGFSTIHGGGPHAGRAVSGVLAAMGASLLWGTMYIPYRKAYLSGMNPLSFVTVFTLGELGTVFALVMTLDGGTKAALFHSPETIHLLFWLFLGGFAWVIGDLYQQFATKYLGIGRAIPLSNTNQLWGLAWGALVFGELSALSPHAKGLVIAGSMVMIAGAAAPGGPTRPAFQFMRRAELSYMARPISSESTRPSSFSFGSKIFQSAMRSARVSSSAEKYSLR